MYKRFFAVCIAFVLAVQTVFSVYAENNRLITDEVINATIDTDWGLFLYGRMYSDREKASDKINAEREKLDALLKEEGFVRPTEFQKAAIVLSAYGITDKGLMQRAVYNNSEFSRQGINAYIWAIIAANCTGIYEDEGGANKLSDIVDYLLSKQLSDGGFNLVGNGADTDITAAAIYALAPLKNDNTKIKNALENATDALLCLQQEDGGFCSMGNPNCESTAQAVIALCAVGMGDDECTIKAVSKLYEYKTEGGFSHLYGGKANGMSTVQAGLALAASELSKNGKQLFFNCAEDFHSGFFCYDNLPQPETTVGTTEATPESVATEITDTDIPATTPETVPTTPATTPPISDTEVTDITTPPTSQTEVTDITTPPTSQTEVTDITTTPTSQTEVADITTPPTSQTEVADITTPPTSQTEVAEITTPPTSQTEVADITTPPTETNSPESSATNSDTASSENSSGITDGENPILPVSLIIICVIAAGFLCVAFKKGNKAAKYIPVMIVISAAVIAVILLIFSDESGNGDKPHGVESSAFSGDNSTEIPEAVSYCEFKITSEKANGEIIFDGKAEYKKGDSVYDMLVRICTENNIQFESSYTPAFDSYYIEGINNLYEMDYGPSSGWIYRVNGEIPNVGCSGYKLTEKDRVEFIYTLELGRT